MNKKDSFEKLSSFLELQNKKWLSIKSDIESSDAQSESADRSGDENEFDVEMGFNPLSGKLLKMKIYKYSRNRVRGRP